jgi:hypothetical protein
MTSEKGCQEPISPIYTVFLRLSFSAGLLLIRLDIFIFATIIMKNIFKTIIRKQE